MDKSGPELAADLSNLRVVATRDLPSLEFIFASLNNMLANTRLHDTSGFGGWGPADPVHPSWTMLRDDLTDVMGHTAQALQVAGEVLSHIVETFAATDAAAAEALRSAWSDGPPGLYQAEQPPGPAPTILFT